MIQDLNRRRQAAKESTPPADCQVPSHVHLVFSARAQAELSLLQSDIISKARWEDNRRYRPLHERSLVVLYYVLPKPSVMNW